MNSNSLTKNKRMTGMQTDGNNNLYVTKYDTVLLCEDHNFEGTSRCSLIY